MKLTCTVLLCGGYVFQIKFIIYKMWTASFGIGSMNKTINVKSLSSLLPRGKDSVLYIMQNMKRLEKDRNNIQC